MISIRLASLAASSEATEIGAAGSSAAKAEAGLFRDRETGQLICYSCGQAASASGGTQQHAASQNCAYNRLLRLLSLAAEAPSDQEKMRAVHSLQTLKGCIGQSLGGMVESFGYARRLVDFTIARCHHLGLMPRRPGDLIEQVLACQDVFGVFTLEALLPAVDIRMMLQDTPSTSASASAYHNATPAASQLQIDRPTVEVAVAPITVSSVGAFEPPTDRCVVCRTAARDRVVLPCAHFSACHRCLSAASQCPVCRASILATLTAYIC